MPVRLIVTFSVQPGRADDFARLWPERIAEVHQEPGCEQYELFRSTSRPDTAVLLELWSSAETLAAHGELNRTRTPIGRDLLVDRPALERFET
ncbi:MAG: antibiotic biosynthesis monooxygenase [Chloroflexi bacterium]|nr:antibiotic biosynthesis monooxygenase [Chloroflexota bacterium]MBV9547923.1 antibiotic biosynthesis monooxygenase [Chloroflexota bacterium]